VSVNKLPSNLGSETEDSPPPSTSPNIRLPPSQDPPESRVGLEVRAGGGARQSAPESPEEEVETHQPSSTLALLINQEAIKTGEVERTLIFWRTEVARAKGNPGL
jgi:hypothetical protein